VIADASVAALVGVGLGAVTGMPIGVVNVAIVDASLRGEVRYAIGIGLGGALADALHSTLAFAGIGHLLSTHPSWTSALAIAAASIIIGYAAFGARAITARKPRAGSGIVAGLLLTLPNPAPLAAWAAIAAAIWPGIAVSLAIVVGACVGIGSALWFTLLARWIAKLPRHSRLARALPIVALILFVAIAIAGVARALVS
jgi:threonine/homoserine/homoserine lactone efflux protein